MPKQNRLVSSGNDCSIIVWDMASHKSTQCITKAHGNFIYSIAAIDDCSFATSGEDYFIKLWAFTDGGEGADSHHLLVQCVGIMPTPTNTNWSVLSLSTAGTAYILAGSCDGSLLAYEKTGSPVSEDSFQNVFFNRTEIDTRGIDIEKTFQGKLTRSPSTPLGKYVSVSNSRRVLMVHVEP